MRLRLQAKTLTWLSYVLINLAHWMAASCLALMVIILIWWRHL